jgi:hypothetical protein
MKKKSLLLIAFCSVIGVATLISWKSNVHKNISGKAINHESENPDSRPVIALRKMKLKAGITADDFEQFAAKAANDGYGKLPGVKFYFGKGERGDEPGSYLYFMEFDSKTTRNFYAPDEDDNAKRSAEAIRLLDVFYKKFDEDLHNLAEVITPAGKKGYVDYIIIK